MNSVQSVTNTMLDGYPLLDDTLSLHLSAVDVTVRSNSQPLLDQLRHYFRHLVAGSAYSEAKKVEVIAIERPTLQLNQPWQNWMREPDKEGRKDAYIDGDGFRLINKVRTGMLFLQSLPQCIAAGPCEANGNQVINFIINQQMTVLQQRGWLICHASAIVKNGRALAFAGFSGGGKSTLMLHLMANPAWKFVTNDRLFIKEQQSALHIEGVPKLPRVNPGTLLNNPQLRSLLPAQQIGELEAMPTDLLWNLEQKYDVDVLNVYGEQRIQHQATLSHFIVLNWSHDSDEATRISRVNLDHRPEVLHAIMKSSGPFYQRSDGSFQQDNIPLPQDAYHALLTGVDLLEVQGKVDFSHLCNFCETVLACT